MSTTSLTSLRTFIKSLHGWTLNIEKAQSSINGMNVSMHNYLEYTILLNVPKNSHISFHWFKHVRLYALSEPNFGSYLTFESIFKSCKPCLLLHEGSFDFWLTQFWGCLFMFWFLIWKFWNTIYEFLTLYVEFPFRFFI